MSMMAHAKTLRDYFEAQNEIFVEHSKLLHARYTSLVAAGFSEDQAMHFITQRSLS